jgi:hypothetical protein
MSNDREHPGPDPAFHFITVIESPAIVSVVAKPWLRHRKGDLCPS